MFMVLKYYFVETLKIFENKNSYFSNYTFKMFIELKIKCVGAVPMKGYQLTIELLRGYRNKCIWSTGTVPQKLT